MKEDERKDSAFPECSSFHRESVEPPGRLPFFPMRGANLSECALFPRKKKLSRPEEHPRATRERPCFWRREISYRTETKREEREEKRKEKERQEKMKDEREDERDKMKDKNQGIMRK